MRRRTTAAALVAACLACVVLTATPALALKAPALQVTGASLIVAGSNQPLYGQQQNTERAIASTTKLMTALIVLQHVHKLGTVFTQGPWRDQIGDSQIGLIPGERMSVRNLLKAMLIPSADDAAEDLAYNVGGRSVPHFLAMMNAEAKKLGLTHTHYTTPTGLDTPGNYSSAADLTRLADYDLQHWAVLRRIVRTRTTTIWTANRSQSYYLTNTDTLLGAIRGIDGVKTGHTDQAGYVLVSAGTKDGMTLIDAVLGTSSAAARNQNALRLLRWGFSNFHKVTPVHKGRLVARPTVSYESPARVVAARGFQVVVPRHAKVRVKVKVPNQLPAPLRRGATVGTETVLVNSHRVDRVPLILAQALPAVPFTTKVAHFFGRPFTLLGILLVVCGGAVLIRERRRPLQGTRPGVVQLGGVEEQ